MKTVTNLRALTRINSYMDKLSSDEDRAAVMEMLRTGTPDPELTHVADMIRAWIAKSADPVRVLGYVLAEYADRPETGKPITTERRRSE